METWFHVIVFRFIGWLFAPVVSRYQKVAKLRDCKFRRKNPSSGSNLTVCYCKRHYFVFYNHVFIDFHSNVNLCLSNIYALHTSEDVSVNDWRTGIILRHTLDHQGRVTWSKLISFSNQIRVLRWCHQYTRYLFSQLNGMCL